MPPRKHEAAAKRTSRFYVANQVMYSAIGRRFYFVPKAEVVGVNTCLVVGKKYDVTDSIAQYVRAKFKAAKPARRRKP